MKNASYMPITEIKPSRKMPDITEDIRKGLFSKPRKLPPKYLYDSHGSKLFEKICLTPEYYLTRTEDHLLNLHSKAIINQVRPDEILELGSGNAEKTCRLFDACESNEHTCSYAPIDVSPTVLQKASQKLCSNYDWLTIRPLVADYHAGLGEMPRTDERCMFVFLGGTIGNFSCEQAKQFINDVKNCMKRGDYLLLGADRVKDEYTLNAAYNDNQGITAEFNLNVLKVLNRELDADFVLDNFQHRAEFNTQKSRIEMRLVCTHGQTVSFQRMGEMIDFRQGDTILTEVSYKFTVQGLESLIEGNGLRVSSHYETKNPYFSLLLATL